MSSFLSWVIADSSHHRNLESVTCTIVHHSGANVNHLFDVPHITDTTPPAQKNFPLHYTELLGRNKAETFGRLRFAEQVSFTRLNGVKKFFTAFSDLTRDVGVMQSPETESAFQVTLVFLIILCADQIPLIERSSLRRKPCMSWPAQA